MADKDRPGPSTSSARKDTRRVAVAAIVMALLILTSLALLYQSDADRLEAAGNSLATDAGLTMVIPLQRGMPSTPIYVSRRLDDGRRVMSVTLLDDRVSGARKFRIFSKPYEADASIAQDFVRYRVLRISAELDCSTGAVEWTNYEIAIDAVGPPVKSSPRLTRPPSDLPAVLDSSRTALICEADLVASSSNA